MLLEREVGRSRPCIRRRGMTMAAAVSVIIAAKDAEGRIARAIRSSLDQGEVKQVIVVDDGSRDSTAAAARAADDGTGRLEIIRLDTNLGPAAARNVALEAATAPFVAIADSDDFVLPGRFARLLDGGSLDLVADNIAFVDEEALPGFDVEQVPVLPSAEFQLELTDFVLRNISKRRAPRGELGFLKPVIRKDFLQAHRLRYNEQMRLGEDFDLYARMLALGARFLVSRTCGYVAVERCDSLSARHSVEDLERMVRADEELIASFALSRGERTALRRHRAHVARKIRHGTFLDAKRRDGAGAAMRVALANPWDLFDLAASITGDKLEHVVQYLPGPPREAQPSLRLLLAPSVESTKGKS